MLLAMCLVHCLCAWVVYIYPNNGAQMSEAVLREFDSLLLYQNTLTYTPRRYLCDVWLRYAIKVGMGPKDESQFV